jgi:hypothetical protein
VKLSFNKILQGIGCGVFWGTVLGFFPPKEWR